jgi:nucleoside-diphosphate-sugar epimerase
MTNTVLVLGARGRLGGAVAQAFAAAGWRVLAQRRAGGTAPRRWGIEWVQAEAGDTATLQRGCRRPGGGACDEPGLHRRRLARASAGPDAGRHRRRRRRWGRSLLFPGNVYNFGADMPTLLARHAAAARALRKAASASTWSSSWRRRRGARPAGGGIRAGDFFGAGNGSWLDQVIVKKLPQGRVTWPGALDAPHAWAYLPDLARAFVRVAETTPATAGGRYECLHFAGHTVTGQDWLAALTEVAWEQGWLPADGALRTGTLPWGMMRLLSPFNATVASLLEMRYLWDVPHALDGAALARRIGAEPHTPFLDAVRAAITQLDLAPRGRIRPAPGAGRPITQGV